MSIREIAERSYYQNFDILGAGRGSSNSGEKYKLSKLDNHTIEDKSCLDIGCNAGYFLFRLLDKQPKKLIGIDLGPNFIEIANELNKEHFKSDKVEFIRSAVKPRPSGRGYKAGAKHLVFKNS